MLNLKQYFAIEKNKALMIIKAVMLVLTLSAFLANVFCAFEYNKALLTVTAYVALASLLASLFYCRKNWYAVIMLAVMTVTVYSAWVDCMWFFVYPFEQSVASTSASMRMMCAYALFSFAVLCFINKEFEKPDEGESAVTKECFNPIIVAGLLLLLCVIFFIGYSKPVDGNSRGVLKPIYEYSLVLFIFAYVYSGKRWYTLLPTTVLLFAFAAKDLLYGGRKTAISLVILFFLVFLSHRLSFIKVLPFALVGLVGFSAIGHFRGNADFSLEQIKITVNAMLYQKFAIDTMYSASYTGTTFIAAVSEGIFTLSERLIAFVNFIASMILGGGKVKNSNIALMTREYYLHWNGGVLPAYGYFFFGWIGTLITGAVSGLWIRIGNSRKTQLKQVLLLWITCTCFSWILYTPSSLLRGVLFMLIGYFACTAADKLMHCIFAYFKGKRS